MKKTLSVNGAIHEMELDPRTTLLDLLRDTLDLTGTKKGCDHGQCGACTVHVDGKAVLSCLQLAATLNGSVTTIEGIGTEDAPHPIQEAFLRHDAYQCGFCTPGQIMSALSCINEGNAGSSEEIKLTMSGNLCRCAAYKNILAAVESARDTMEVQK
ncbi:MAG: (2Fe-2S)-binding protein [Pseudomonadota bacterium]